MKILIIENDYTTADNIAQALKQQSYKVDIATDATSGLKFTIAREYNLIILDLCVPSDNSINLYQYLRFQAKQTPILLLTQQDATDTLLEVLDDKIDDYLLKPFAIEDLILRSQILLRKTKPHIRTYVLSWGDLRLDQAKLKVTYQNHPVSLTRKEYQLIELFLLHPQQVFSRSSIIAHIWSGEESPSEAAVTNLIKDLRQKFKLAGMETDPIETVYGIGYHLKNSPLLESQILTSN
ncbi:MAG: response regulator transcription factor [Nostocaceae cyanobacterium]|nr:response regulator transcription factor [Nostocaceae cyanobacterium]